MQRSDKSAFFDSILAVVDYDEEGRPSWSAPEVKPIKMEVDVPIEQKEDGLYVSGKKVFDLKKDEAGKLDLVPVSKKLENDVVYDYFYDSLDDWKPGTDNVDDVEVTVHIGDTHSEGVNTGNPNDNESEMVADNYRVYYLDSDIDITKILDKSEIKKIEDKIWTYLNEELDWD